MTDKWDTYLFLGGPAHGLRRSIPKGAMSVTVPWPCPEWYRSCDGASTYRKSYYATSGDPLVCFVHSTMPEEEAAWLARAAWIEKAVKEG